MNSVMPRSRSFSLRAIAITSARTLGPASAAPVPCSTRAAISQPGDCARPPSKDASTKTRIPVRNARSWPSMSPSRPPSSSKPPKARPKALSTQVRPAGLNPRSCSMRGSATTTIKRSMANMNWAARIVSSASPRLRGAGVGRAMVLPTRLVAMAASRAWISNRRHVRHRLRATIRRLPSARLPTPGRRRSARCLRARRNVPTGYRPVSSHPVRRRSGHW
jgi:hypothetical protein